jgi:hypothetical protein
MKRKKQKRYDEMTTEELAEATKEFDEPFVIDKFRPLTPEERKLWNRAKRKGGRPRVGQGVKVISLSVEKGLLAKADRLAKKLNISRAQLISRGLQKVLADESAKRTG